MSSINPNNINGQYPIAGQDNDSQGFRDNFTNIKNNFNFAKSEIENLQASAILRTPLAGTTAGVNFNEMNNTQLKGVQLIRSTETIVQLGAISDSTFSINWLLGHYQHLTLNVASTLTFLNWPEGLYTKLRLEITCGPTDRLLTLDPTKNYNGLSTIEGVTSNTVIPLRAGQVYLFEFSTRTAGGTIFVQDLYRNTVSTSVEKYQYLTPANASVSTVDRNVSAVIVDPAGTISSANIVLPGNTQVYDGQTISFAFGATITALTLFGNGATVLGGLTTAGVTTPATYVYKTSTNKWYRLS